MYLFKITHSSINTKRIGSNACDAVVVISELFKRRGYDRVAVLHTGGSAARSRGLWLRTLADDP